MIIAEASLPLFTNLISPVIAGLVLAVVALVAKSLRLIYQVADQLANLKEAKAYEHQEIRNDIESVNKNAQKMGYGMIALIIYILWKSGR